MSAATVGHQSRLSQFSGAGGDLRPLAIESLTRAEGVTKSQKKSGKTNQNKAPLTKQQIPFL